VSATRVLVADDERDILELVAFRLERSGYRDRAGEIDGEEALRLALEAAPGPRGPRRDDAVPQRLRT
jgi:DNA-binding response OmpR family regulator